MRLNFLILNRMIVKGLLNIVVKLVEVFTVKKGLLHLKTQTVVNIASNAKQMCSKR